MEIGLSNTSIAPMQTCYTIAMHHPCFAGHFPSHPVLPAVLILDYVVQTACIHSGEFAAAINNPEFTSQLEWQQLKFTAEIGPADQIVVVLSHTPMPQKRFGFKVYKLQPGAVTSSVNSSSNILAASGNVALLKS